IPRLRTDLGALLSAAAAGRLAEVGELEWDDRACVTVVLASGGYPGSYQTGKVITGLADVSVDDALVFHAGTTNNDSGIVTAGGRVLAVSGLGADVPVARANAYAAADQISFEGLHRREDIAAGVKTSP